MRNFKSLLLAGLAALLGACASVGGSTITSVTVSPGAIAVNPGGTVNLTAIVAGTGTFSSAVNWTTTGGTLSSTTGNNVTLTTPNAPGSQVVVTARSQQDTSKFGTSTITINIPGGGGTGPLVVTVTNPANGATVTTDTFNLEFTVAGAAGPVTATVTVGANSPMAVNPGQPNVVPLGTTPNGPVTVTVNATSGTQTGSAAFTLNVNRAGGGGGGNGPFQPPIQTDPNGHPLPGQANGARQINNNTGLLWYVKGTVTVDTTKIAGPIAAGARVEVFIAESASGPAIQYLLDSTTERNATMNTISLGLTESRKYFLIVRVNLTQRFTLEFAVDNTGPQEGNGRTQGAANVPPANANNYIDDVCNQPNKTAAARGAFQAFLSNPQLRDLVINAGPDAVDPSGLDEVEYWLVPESSTPLPVAGAAGSTNNALRVDAIRARGRKIGTASFNNGGPNDFRVNVPTTGGAVPDNMYHFLVITVDQMGNSTASSNDGYRFQIDNTGPMISGLLRDNSPLPFPAQPGYLSDYGIFTGALFDSGIGFNTDPTFQLGGISFPLGIAPCGTKNFPVPTQSFDSNRIADGVYSVATTITDMLGNPATFVGNGVQGDTITVDNTDPDVAVIAPADGNTNIVSGNNVQVSFRVTDTTSGIYRTYGFWSDRAMNNLQGRYSSLFLPVPLYDATHFSPPTLTFGTGQSSPRDAIPYTQVPGNAKRGASNIFAPVEFVNSAPVGDARDGSFAASLIAPYSRYEFLNGNAPGPFQRAPITVSDEVIHPVTLFGMAVDRAGNATLDDSVNVGVRPSIESQVQNAVPTIGRFDAYMPFGSDGDATTLGDNQLPSRRYVNRLALPAGGSTGIDADDPNPRPGRTGLSGIDPLNTTVALELETPETTSNNPGNATINNTSGISFYRQFGIAAWARIVAWQDNESWDAADQFFNPPAFPLNAYPLAPNPLTGINQYYAKDPSYGLAVAGADNVGIQNATRQLPGSRTAWGRTVSALATALPGFPVNADLLRLRNLGPNREVDIPTPWFSFGNTFVTNGVARAATTTENRFQDIGGSASAYTGVVMDNKGFYQFTGETTTATARARFNSGAITYGVGLRGLVTFLVTTSNGFNVPGDSALATYSCVTNNPGLASYSVVSVVQTQVAGADAAYLVTCRATTTFGAAGTQSLQLFKAQTGVPNTPAAASEVVTVTVVP